MRFCFVDDDDDDDDDDDVDAMAPRKTRHVTSRVVGAEEERCDVSGASDDDAIVVVLAKDDEITPPTNFLSRTK